MSERKLIIEYDANYNDREINYMFQRLITPLAIGSKFEPYKEDHSLITETLNQIIEWAISYEDERTLSFIDNTTLKKYSDILYDLDGKYLSTKGIYMEDAYIWIEQLEVLAREEKNINEIINKTIEYINKALSFDSYKIVKKDYEGIKNKLLEWTNTNKLKEITHEESLEIHKILDDAKEKILFDKNIGDEKELSDNILIWYEVLIKEINKTRNIML